MEKLARNCPYCDGTMEVERLKCTSCDVVIEGNIQIPRLARLSAEERSFIEMFVRSSGSLKAMASKLGVSYPTVRNRLNKVIEALQEEEEKEVDARRAILDAIEEGKITVDEAIKLLQEL